MFLHLELISLLNNNFLLFIDFVFIWVLRGNTANIDHFKHFFENEEFDSHIFIKKGIENRQKNESFSY